MVDLLRVTVVVPVPFDQPPDGSVTTVIVTPTLPVFPPEIENDENVLAEPKRQASLTFNR